MRMYCMGRFLQDYREISTVNLTFSLFTGDTLSVYHLCIFKHSRRTAYDMPAGHCCLFEKQTRQTREIRSAENQLPPSRGFEAGSQTGVR